MILAKYTTIGVIIKGTALLFCLSLYTLNFTAQMCRNGARMKATKIKMNTGCGTSDSLLEIDSIYITGCKNEGFYKKAKVYDYLKENPGTIQVNIKPYPNLIPMLSSNKEKFVKSTPNNTSKDNLLSLPRE